MAQIFISYSTKDQTQANEVVNYLEKYGYTCFIASRDIKGGMDFSESIKAQLSTPNSVLVLLFSENSDASLQVKLEISQAISNDVPIIPLRITNATPKNLAYFLQLSQWVDLDERDKYKNLMKSLSEYIQPKIVIHDDNERYLLDFFERYTITLVPNERICNANYNRYVFSIAQSQLSLFELLLVSLKNNFGYFENGRLILDNKFPCILQLNAENCLVTVDYATNDHTTFTAKADQVEQKGEFCLTLGFDEYDKPYHLDLNNKHLFLENLTTSNCLQIQYLLRKSFLTGETKAKMFFLNKWNTIGKSFSVGTGEILPFDTEIDRFSPAFDDELDKLKRSLLDVNYKISREQIKALQSNAQFVNTINADDVKNEEENLLLDNLVTALYKRMTLFSKCEVENIEQYNAEYTPLERIVVILNSNDHNGMFSSEFSHTLNLLVNKFRCAKYGIHFVVFRHYNDRKPTLKEIFKRDTIVGNFLHEYALDCDETLLKVLPLSKHFTDLLVEGKHLCVPFVLEQDDIYEQAIRLYPTKINRYQANLVSFYWILPDMLKFVESNQICYLDMGEMYSIGKYYICDLTIETVFEFYKRLGVVKIVGDYYCLSKTDYDNICFDLQSM